ncbi:MAG TPA: N-acetylmuramoyl-L-alanine amidase [Chloroflexota bacterium]|nr:N-acetylmuramoyl-L-alanine amidase [Chloroflexota bacterium]
MPVFAESEIGGITGEVGVVDVGLDPGHSDADVGASGGGLRECDLTLEVATRVKSLLEEEGLSVVLSRTDNRPLTDFSNPDPTEQIRLEQEARVAAVGRARVFVSIHFNGYGDPSVRGAECYYNGDNQGEPSQRLGRGIQNKLLAEVTAAGYDLPDRGVKEDLSAGKPYGHFFSLRGDMPSVLVEAMFLTNPHEAFLVGDKSIREAVARGIASGVWQQISSSHRPIEP